MEAELKPPEPPAELSEREIEILRLVATGASNKQIAQQLTISPNTVKVHLRNIFAKIGAASRTEAAMYAARAGLVTIPVADSTAPAPPPVVVPPLPRLSRRWIYALAASALGLVVLTVLLTRLIAPVSGPPTSIATAPPPNTWEEKAPLLTARRGLAAAAYANWIYAIGGETATGPTGINERYDPASNTWTGLKPKPAPVTDIQAAVIGGLIYIPGGQLASGQPSDQLEVYNPRLDTWEQRASLPKALSAYALAAFEGKLYVLGGWDGKNYLADVYQYNPDLDTWTTLAPLPTARGSASAAVAGGKVYVVGGVTAQGLSTANEAFSLSGAWQSGAALPANFTLASVASASDNIYAVVISAGVGIKVLEYRYEADTWYLVNTADLPQEQTAASAVILGGNLHVFGGQSADTLAAQQYVYKLIYTVTLPFISQ